MGPAARIIAVLSVLAVAACSAGKAPVEPAATPATFSVTGKVTLGLGHFDSDDATQICWGDCGYDDLKAGAQVVVSDPAGATIAVGTISGAQTQHGDYVKADGNPLADSCVLTFQVPNVPAGKGFYGVEVSHRGRLQYPEAQARQAIDLTL